MLVGGCLPGTVGIQPEIYSKLKPYLQMAVLGARKGPCLGRRQSWPLIFIRVFQTPQNLYGKEHLQHQDDDAIWYGSIEYTPYMGTQNEQTHCQATVCTGVLNTAMLLIQAMGRVVSKGRNTFKPWSSKRNQLASDRLVLEWGDPRSPVRVVMGEAWMLIIARLSMSQTCLRTQFFLVDLLVNIGHCPAPKSYCM